MQEETALKRKVFHWKPALIAISIVVVGVAGGALVSYLTSEEPTERSIAIEAEQYGFTPPVIRLNRGDTVRLTLSALDVPHGFYLEGYGFDAHMVPEEDPEVRWLSAGTEYESVRVIEFTADKVGKFRFRCSLTCGSLHPFMLGEIIVRPNYLFTAGIGLLIGLTIAIVFLRQRELYA